MSQRDVETLLGRLLTDAQLRQDFFEAPEGALVQGSYEITPRELKALLRIDEQDLDLLAARIDPLVHPTSEPADATHGDSMATDPAAKPAPPTRQASAT